MEHCEAALSLPSVPLDLPDGDLLEERDLLPALDPEILKELDRELRDESPRVRQVSLRIRTSLKRVALVSAERGLLLDRRVYSSFSAQVVTEKDGKLQTGYESLCATLPYDIFLASADLRGAARKALARALLMLDAAPCPAGAMPVVLAGEAGGTLVHEACGHGMEADIVQKDFSVYRDRVGQIVACPSVTLVDDATIPGAFGSYAFDDEGTPAGRTVLVEEGILRAYLTDRHSALRGGLPLTGNGRRESYQNVPIPRMSNTFILPNPKGGSAEDLADQAGTGLFVRKMGGGEVNPTSGDFVFHVTEGYLIEGGRVGRPVRGAVLTGNGPEALTRIRAVGRDLCLEPGICGKGGQGAPVTDGQPSLLIEEMVVGGQDTGDGDDAAA
jgi:TldD protein